MNVGKCGIVRRLSVSGEAVEAYRASREPSVLLQGDGDGGEGGGQQEQENQSRHGCCCCCCSSEFQKGKCLQLPTFSSKKKKSV